MGTIAVPLLIRVITSNLLTIGLRLSEGSINLLDSQSDDVLSEIPVSYYGLVHDELAVRAIPISSFERPNSKSMEIIMDYRNMTVKQFSAKLDDVGKTAKSLQSSIHELAMYGLYHLNVHTNSNPANELLSVLPEGQRVQALKVWFLEFGACVQSTKDEGKLKFYDRAKVRAPENLDPTLVRAEEMPYWLLTRERPVLTFTFGAAELLKQLEKVRGIEGDEEKRKKYKEVQIDSALLARVEAAISEYLNEQVKEELIAHDLLPEVEAV